MTIGEALLLRKTNPKRVLRFEVCAEGMQGCLAAAQGGADRVELCSALSEGGLTPSHAMIQQAVRQSGLPVYPILRPRGGDFVYNDAEFETMVDDLLHAKKLGASGFVLGMLDEVGAVDVTRTRRLVELASPLEVTFHRAFDASNDLFQSLEDVIIAGCRRLLSSGGAPNVLSGAPVLAKVVTQAAGRIEIAVGGGLRVETATQTARMTQATSFHGSVRRASTLTHACVPGDDCGNAWSVHSDDIRTMIAALEAGVNPEADAS